VVALLPSGRVVAGIVCPAPDVPIGMYLVEGKRFVRVSTQALFPVGIDGSDFVFLKRPGTSSGLFEIVREHVPTTIFANPSM
jgi:hypothetical protein